MTHNVTLPLRSCLHTQLRKKGGENGREKKSGSGCGKGDVGYRIKVIEKYEKEKRKKLGKRKGRASGNCAGAGKRKQEMDGVKTQKGQARYSRQ